jgi:hypothetical protein
MQKIFYVFIIVCLVAFTSACKKEGTVTLPIPDTTKSITSVPSSFHQKILIEEFEGTGYDGSPTADYYLNRLITEVNGVYPDRVYGTSIHVGDIMEVPELQYLNLNTLDSTFNNTGIHPVAMANREDQDPSTISWIDCADKIPGLLGQNPKCGLAIDASQINGNVLSLLIHAGFQIDVAGEYHLHVYLVEESVQSSDTLFDQTNSTIDTACPYFYSPNPIHNYAHKNVLRKIISTVPGDGIPAANMKKGKQFVKAYSVNLSGLSWSNCSIIAFVDKYADYAAGHRIMNVQKVSVGSLKNWD